MKIDKCRICLSDDLEEFLDLGDQPWCNDFVDKDQVGKEKRYPLRMCYCHNCTTVQITDNVPKEIMYHDHPYLSGYNRSMLDHFRKISNDTCKKIGNRKVFVVDIGSNDGTLLSTYKDLGMEVLGIEPCNKAAFLAEEKGINTNCEFFDNDHALDIKSSHGKADIISAANVFYHVEDLHSITSGIKSLLNEDGIFIMQGSYLPYLMDIKAFDIFYHEHLLYYRIKTLSLLLDLHGLEIFDVDIFPNIHGGSIAAYIGHIGSHDISRKVTDLLESEQRNMYDSFDKYKEFGKSIRELGKNIESFVKKLSIEGKTIYAFGAPAKGTVLLNYCNLTSDDVVLAVEKNPLKFGKYIPGTGIPIVNEDNEGEPDYYLLLSWNFAKHFCKSEAFQSGERHFIVPVPKPEIISA